jgi:hypothetical protein
MHFLVPIELAEWPIAYIQNFNFKMEVAASI